MADKFQTPNINSEEITKIKFENPTRKINLIFFLYAVIIMISNIIDAMLFWYKFNKPSSKIFYCGIENLFHYAKYVKEESIFRFFDE